jgi:hypothetical protein
VRRAASRLGRLAGDAGLLALTGFLCCTPASASATASPAPALFRLTISGRATADFDHTTAPEVSEGCETSERSEGVRTAQFRSRRPTVVRIVGGRVQAVGVRAIAGTVTLTGPKTLNEVCATGETHTIKPCAKTTRIFRDARTTVLSTKPGSLTLRPLRLRLQRIECPREPDDLVAAPLGPVPGPLQLSVAALARERITRLTLTASATRHKGYAAPEQGTIVQRSHWTLTFERIRP